MRAEIELGKVANPATLLNDVEFMTQQFNQLLAEVGEIQNFKFSRRYWKPSSRNAPERRTRERVDVPSANRPCPALR